MTILDAGFRRLDQRGAWVSESTGTLFEVKRRSKDARKKKKGKGKLWRDKNNKKRRKSDLVLPEVPEGRLIPACHTYLVHCAAQRHRTLTSE